MYKVKEVVEYVSECTNCEGEVFELTVINKLICTSCSHPMVGQRRV